MNLHQIRLGVHATNCVNQCSGNWCYPSVSCQYSSDSDNYNPSQLFSREEIFKGTI